MNDKPEKPADDGPMDYARQQDVIRARRLRAQRYSEQFEEFIQAAQKAARKHPEHTEQLKYIVDLYRAERPELLKKIEAAQEKIGTKEWHEDDLNKLMADAEKKVHGKLMAQYPLDGGKAWSELAQALQPESVVETATKIVYNSDNGGFQWGGAIGAAVGAFFGWKLTEGQGGLINAVGIVAGTVITAFLAHHVLDSKKDTAPGPDFHARKVVKAPGREKALGNGLTPDGIALAEQEKLSGIADGMVKAAPLTGSEREGFRPGPLPVEMKTGPNEVKSVG